MAFKEHNNRVKANKFAEYITGKVLRQYVADKVKKYLGERSVSVFDGACGSGQLEQFIDISKLVAVEVQQESCEALRSNFPNAVINNQSFFLYQNNEKCECVVMNPPFSIKLKDLSDDEQSSIKAEFNWKKSGVVDDIFTLKGLNNSSRWGFFILFPGVAYRGTEKQFRSLIGNQLVELNRIQNAFEDTQIDVLFLVIDKNKKSSTTIRELYDCKARAVLASDEWNINPEYWENVQLPQEPEKEVDFSQLEKECQEQIKHNVITGVRASKVFTELGMLSISEFNQFCDDICESVQGEKIELQEVA
ncbi:N-6 DNA methylase [Pasteurella sp. PK-2025]|uniref:N-6 DNA methylase n=1 Tax=Pasteurella sp. PK-2025 TaxID=3413133 RepID=UPI003C794EDD